MQLYRYIKQLYSEIGLSGELLEEASSYSLQFDEDVDVAITLEKDPFISSYVCFRGVIVPFSSDLPSNSFYKRVMEANLFGIGTRGGIISLSDKNVLNLSFFVDNNSTYQQFRDLLEDFVSVLIFWREEEAKCRQN